MGKSGDGVPFVERLAVLPDFRHSGYGGKLVDFAVQRARAGGASRLTLSTVDELSVLKDWYRQTGFVETHTQKFPHMLFTVCFMEKDLTQP